MSLRLDWCSHEAAKYAVEHWHYSKSLPMPPLVRIGVWENDLYIGCVIFSRGASPHLGRSYGLPVTDVCELTRVALTRHESPVSRILAIAVRMLRSKDTGLRLIVSFADANEGHHGGIYQASGWIYSGMTSRKFDYIGPDGKRYRDRQITSSGQARQFGKVTRVFTPSQCMPIALVPKHRYLMPLDDEMRKQIAPLAKPYPKRLKGHAPDTLGEVDGSTPIQTLQIEDGTQ